MWRLSWTSDLDHAAHVVQAADDGRVQAHAWVEAKIHKSSKAEIRRRLCDADWTHELVVNRVRFEDELQIIRDEGVIVHLLRDLIDEMTKGELVLKAASGNDLVDLVLLGRERGR